MSKLWEGALLHCGQQALPAAQPQITPGVNRNLCLMPDQRLVAADTPQTFFADWPETQAV